MWVDRAPVMRAKDKADEAESDDLDTLRLLRAKFAEWARLAPPPSTLEEVRMYREAIASELQCIRMLRAMEEDDVDDMPLEQLREKARTLMDRGVL